VRHSHAQSAVAAATLAAHHALGTYRHAVTAYVALTAYQRSLLVSGGMDPGRIRVIPNFLEPDSGRGDATRSGVLFVGRLAVEKGVSPLLGSAAIEPGIVSIAGDGPMAPMVERAHTSGDVAYLGRLAAEEVQLHLKRAAALVVPSIWFEGFPMVVLEAFASATPVLANNIGSLAEVVEDGTTGRLVDVNDASALAAAIRWFHDHPDEARAMGERARQRYEERYRGTSHLAQLLDVYDEATQTLAYDG
jgi:glycosyltransferase involved in cell wall biosynthesis